MSRALVCMVISTAMILMCSDRPDEKTSSSTNSAKKDEDTIEISEIQKRIERMPKGKLPISDYLRMLFPNEILSRSSFSVPVFGRTGPLFVDDGKPEPRRREAFLEFPLNKQAQGSRLVIQVLIGKECAGRSDGVFMADLNRVLSFIGEKGSRCQDPIVWQSRLISQNSSM